MPRLTLTVLALLAASALHAQDTSLYSAMRWRPIGPFRAGRVSAVAGIPGDAATYYMGSPGGGVWKTVDAGTVWTPIFDKVPVASIGSIVVSPSNPPTIYVGTGDVSLVGGAVNLGNGVYKSIDAGHTWTHVGLDNTEHIGTLWIDPKNPDIVIAAALGKTYSKNPDRGIFKTTDGGKTWKKTLYKDDEDGAIDVAFDASNPKIGYAAIWHHLITPGNTGDAIGGTRGGEVFKTTDNGDTWTALTLPDLKPDTTGRIGLATTLNGQRVYAIVGGARGEGGLYRSDDAGATWARSTTDSRITGNGYFSRVFVDPNHPDILYVAQTSLYRSTDGGHTFVSYKGAPGGDDNHALWIDPSNSARMIMASDQGATISMDTGASWSTWYNQPTGQIYHMSTDHRFPYWVYGTQQDSGSVATLSRGDYGAITMLDWDPVAAYEFGYIVPSPLDPNMIYAGGPSRGLVLLNRVNRQVETISPSISRSSDLRFAMNPPLAFSPQDGHIFYEGTQFLLQTSDAGHNWKRISPDLTERADIEDRPSSADINAIEKAAAPTVAAEKKQRTREATETLTPPNRNAINTFSPSTIAPGTLWAGTTNGVIQLTKDSGATWSVVTPPGLTKFSQISILEASHFDPATAYACVVRTEEDDFAPHIYRTRNSGHTWQQITSGIAPTDFVRVIREDPKQPGLLFAGTENATYVSLDDGAHWSPLQLNMPTTSVRDLQIESGDLVAATYGRAFWVLDDIAPLRELAALRVANPAANKPLRQPTLFAPARALRIQLDLNGDTPLPPEMPAGQNPPSGALLDFYLPSTPSTDVTLAIYTSSGELIRSFSTRPGEASIEPPPNVPDYWLARPEPLTRNAGSNRFLWDLRYAPPSSLHHDYPISAMYGATPAQPEGALVSPGTYEVRLTVAGKTYKQPLTIALDPRVHTSQPDLEAQFALEQRSTAMTSLTFDLYHRATLLRDTIAADLKKLQAPQSPADAAATIAALKAFDAKLAAIQGSASGRGGPPTPGVRAKPSLSALNAQFGALATIIDSADTAPTPIMQSTYDEYAHDLATAAETWNAALTAGLPSLNSQLATQKLSALPATPIELPH